MGRFFEGYPWRFLFATIPSPNSDTPSVGGVTTTWANGLLTNRQIQVTLNQPSQITADVYPFERAVNAIFDDGDPLVAQSNRIIYAFRREGAGSANRPAYMDPDVPWVPRAAGILMSPQDQGDPDISLSHLTAFDPWQYLMGRPLFHQDGSFPEAQGTWNFADTVGNAYTGNLIVTNALLNSILNDKSGPLGDGFCFIDAGDGSRFGDGPQYLDWGGTAFYGGTIEATEAMRYLFSQGQSVGQVWSDMCDSGNLDIVLTPIYDPRRPGFTHELNIYKRAGADLPGVVFGWSRMNRALNTIDRMHDGTPGSFVNKLNYYVGQGGPPSNASGPDDHPADVAKYLPYWSLESYPQQSAIGPATGTAARSATQFMAKQTLFLSGKGRRTLTLGATPERSPIAFLEYNVGDRVKVYAPNSLRVISEGYQRVESIPVSVDDDGIEHVDGLLTSPDYRDTVPFFPSS